MILSRAGGRRSSGWANSPQRIALRRSRRKSWADPFTHWRTFARASCTILSAGSGFIVVEWAVDDVLVPGLDIAATHVRLVEIGHVLLGQARCHPLLSGAWHMSQPRSGGCRRRAPPHSVGETVLGAFGRALTDLDIAEVNHAPPPASLGGRIPSILTVSPLVSVSSSSKEGWASDVSAWQLVMRRSG